MNCAYMLKQMHIIFIIKQGIRKYVPYSLPFGMTEWVDIFFGKMAKKIDFFKIPLSFFYPRATPWTSASFISSTFNSIKRFYCIY